MPHRCLGCPMMAMLEVSTAALQGLRAPLAALSSCNGITWRDAPVGAFYPRPFTGVPACCSVCVMYSNQLLTDNDLYLTCATTWFQGGSITLNMWRFTNQKTKQNKPQNQKNPKASKQNPKPYNRKNIKPAIRPQQTTEPNFTLKV